MGEKRLLSNEQQRVVKAGGQANSFYDVYDDDMTEEERQQYKRLIGMPLAEDYDELIANLK